MNKKLCAPGFSTLFLLSLGLLTSGRATQSVNLHAGSDAPALVLEKPPQITSVVSSRPRAFRSASGPATALSVSAARA